MPNVLIRTVPADVVARLKTRAQANRRSMEAEARAILESGARQLTMAEFRAAAARLRRPLAGRRFADSAPGIRRDRERR